MCRKFIDSLTYGITPKPLWMWPLNTILTDKNWKSMDINRYLKNILNDSLILKSNNFNSYSLDQKIIQIFDKDNVEKAIEWFFKV